MPIIVNIFDKAVVPRILEATNYLEHNDEEGARRMVCEMIRAGVVQFIRPTEIGSGLVTEDQSQKAQQPQLPQQ